jgi:hypothetical protein
MHLLRPRSLTATALSLWIGFLACVLGCAQPVLSSTKPAHAHLSEPESAARGDANGTVGSEGPCCHHTGGSQKSKQTAQTISCCPLDATLFQKQDPVSHLRDFSSALIFTLLQFGSSLELSARTAASEPPLRHTGRDLLLQTRLLRI